MSSVAASTASSTIRSFNIESQPAPQIIIARAKSKGRFKHWSQPLLFVAGCGVLGIGGYAYYKEAYTEAAILTGIAITIFVGFWYLRKFAPERNLEQNVQALGNTERDLNTRNEALTQSVNKLERINKELGSKIEQGQEDIKKVKEELVKKEIAYDEAILKLERTAAQLERVKEVFEHFKKSASHLSHSLEEFNTLAQDSTQNHQQLVVVVDQMGQNTHRLHAANQSLNDQTSSLEASHKSIETTIEQLSCQVLALTSLVVEMSKNQQMLSPEVITETEEKIHQAAHDISDCAAETNELKRVVQSLKSISDDDIKKLVAQLSPPNSPSMPMPRLSIKPLVSSPFNYANPDERYSTVASRNDSASSSSDTFHSPSIPSRLLPNSPKE